MADALNLTSLTTDNAVVFPAIQSIFISYSRRPDVQEELARHGMRSFDVLSFISEAGLYHYDYALYSAGNAQLAPARWHEEGAIWNRRPDVVLMSDSGGYQVSTGRWTPRQYAHKRAQILRWQEKVSKLAIAMDVPTSSVADSRVPSIATYEDAFEWSVDNFEWTIRNRDADADTRILNVLQGRDEKETFRWYDAVKRYCDEDKYSKHAFQGWALGGLWELETKVIVKLLARMRADGLLTPRTNWMHVLGVTRPERVASFTMIQRAVREVTGDLGFTISCDSSSPILSVGRGSYYRRNLTKENSKIKDAKLPTDELLEPSQVSRFGILLRVDDEIGHTSEFSGADMRSADAALRMFGDSVFVNTPLHSVGSLISKSGKGKGRPNPLGYAVFKAASIQAFIQKVYEESAQAVNAEAITKIADALRTGDAEAFEALELA